MNNDMTFINEQIKKESEITTKIITEMEKVIVGHPNTYGLLIERSPCQ